MKIFYGLSSIVLFLANFSLQAAPSWEAQGPYIEASIGGTTFQQQTTRENLIATTVIGNNAFLTADDIYVHIHQDNSFDLLVNAAVGYRINPIIRTAIALSYFKNTLATRNNSLFNSSTSYVPAKTWLYTANIYADFGSVLCESNTAFNPYVGVGLGAANNKLDSQVTYVDSVSGSGTISITDPSSRTNFAYKLMAGINYSLSDHLLLNLQYAFVNAGEFVFGANGSTPPNSTYVFINPGFFSIYANQLSAGLIYNFC